MVLFCSNLLSTYVHFILTKNQAHSNWSNKTRIVPSQNLMLENEIYDLRKQMEQMFQQEQSFTAENVMKISSMLDLKINEYMRSNIKQSYYKQD